jgi:predicted NUDIX family NTP pyrophosphohydrolase
LTRRSAGILLYRSADGGIEVLLAHPGGPVWASRDAGVWTIPKGEIDLGEITQKGGKVVVGWGLEGDLDPATAKSNTFPFQWPPKSGRYITVPEIDRVEWFTPDEARRRIKDTQIPLIDRLLEALDRP